VAIGPRHARLELAAPRVAICRVSESEALAVPGPSGPPSPACPAGLEITYPPELSRWRPLVQRLLVIPYAIDAAVLYWLTAFMTERYPPFIWG
jgi:hypothetical protein